MRKITIVVLLIAFLSIAYAENWPGWRGPGGLGISSGKVFPVKWDMTKNVKCNDPSASTEQLLYPKKQ
jgi:hypothetical protein